MVAINAAREREKERECATEKESQLAEIREPDRASLLRRLPQRELLIPCSFAFDLVFSGFFFSFS